MNISQPSINPKNSDGGMAKRVKSYLRLNDAADDVIHIKSTPYDDFPLRKVKSTVEVDVEYELACGAERQLLIEQTRRAQADAAKKPKGNAAAKVHYLDSIRGICCLCVVFYHAYKGFDLNLPVDYPLYDNPLRYFALSNFVFMFR